MSSNESDERNLAGLTEACGEMQLGVDLVDAKVSRCCETAFENSERALKAVIALTRGYGAEATIGLLEDKGWMPRSHYFGFLRGHLFSPNARKAAHTALKELPDVLREREALMIKRDDLLRTRRHILERLDRERLDGGREEISRKLETGRQRS